MDDDHSKCLDKDIEQLIAEMKMHGLTSDAVKSFLDKHKDKPYFGEFQIIVDIQELIQVGLI